MCGIVGIVAKRDVAKDLLDGIKKLEYRGYDSAGIAVFNKQHGLQRLRVVGKVNRLVEEYQKHPINGEIGISHTRWATHGEPTEINAHPHISKKVIALVHNGIIENHQELRVKLEAKGYEFQSDTDTEVIAHLIHKNCIKGIDFVEAVALAVKELKGAFSLAIMHHNDSDRIIGVRCGSPLVAGFGNNENYLASDVVALLPLTKKFIYLEEGDIVEVKRDKITVYDSTLNIVARPIKETTLNVEAIDLAGHKHFMEKEIYEQPQAIADTIASGLKSGKTPEIIAEAFTGSIDHVKKIFSKINEIQIIACGSSYHAGLVAYYWLEKLAGIPCKIEVASEFRHRNPIIKPNTLLVTISQSGETADTLAALREAKKSHHITSLTICNAQESALVRESDLAFITRAGVEVGVATTKAFTAQLVALFLLTAALNKQKKNLSVLNTLLRHLKQLPILAEQALTLNTQIYQLAQKLANKSMIFFIGRGINYPIAMEGALKMKEISYIHAEAYPAGELKHGPIALIEKGVPVITLAPDDELLGKIQSNLSEIKARSGQLIILAGESFNMPVEGDMVVIRMPHVVAELAPIIYVIALQLLAYYVAVLKGTDVDKPRNLAKSVTVE